MLKFDDNSWKQVNINYSKFNDPEGQFLGIEECTDYNLPDILSLKPENGAKKGNKKSKRKKLKVSKEDFRPSKSGCTSQNVSLENVDDEDNVGDVSDYNVDAWNIVPLAKSILLALAENAFFQPTEIQRLTLPAAILGKRDILGAAETGSGKTLAFGLPILSGILKIKNDYKKNNITENEQNFLHALILTPTRELAVQIKNHLTIVAKYTGIQTVVLVGGMAAVKQERLLHKKPEIIVATPGRLWELIEQGNEHLSSIENISFLAIDETDRMVEKGHFKELHQILEKINLDEEKVKKRQNFVFSATLTTVHELPMHLLAKKKLKLRRNLKEMTPTQKLQKVVEQLGITNPKVVDLTEGKGTSGTLTESRIMCSLEDKDYYVYYFLEKYPGRTLIFCNSIGCVRRLITLFTLLNKKPLALHASMQQRQRLKNLDRFRDVPNSILIATDVAARGLDIPKIDHVVHYQTPRTSEGYVHRSGRTARASSEGLTVLLVEPAELTTYLRLCRTLGKDSDIPLFPVDENFLSSIKERVNLARELDKLDLHVKKASAENGWLLKAAEDMDMIVDDNFSAKYDIEEARKLKKRAEIKRKMLSSLLTQPIFSRNVTTKYLFGQKENMSLLNPEQQTALQVMQNKIETTKNKAQRKRSKGVFRSKIGNINKTIDRKDLLKKIGVKRQVRQKKNKK